MSFHDAAAGEPGGGDADVLAADGAPGGACDPPHETMIPTRYPHQCPVDLVSISFVFSTKKGPNGSSAGPSHAMQRPRRETAATAHWIHTSRLRMATDRPPNAGTRLALWLAEVPTCSVEETSLLNLVMSRCVSCRSPQLALRAPAAVVGVAAMG